MSVSLLGGWKAGLQFTHMQMRAWCQCKQPTCGFEAAPWWAELAEAVSSVPLPSVNSLGPLSVVGFSLQPLCSKGTNLLLLPSLPGCLFPEPGYLYKSIPVPGVINLRWVKMLLEGIGRQHHCTNLSLDRTRIKIPWRERKEGNNLFSETSIHSLTKTWVKQGFSRQHSSSQTSGRTSLHCRHSYHMRLNLQTWDMNLHGQIHYLHIG